MHLPRAYVKTAKMPHSHSELCSRNREIEFESFEDYTVQCTCRSTLLITSDVDILCDCEAAVERHRCRFFGKISNVQQPDGMPHVDVDHADTRSCSSVSDDSDAGSEYTVDSAATLTPGAPPPVKRRRVVDASGSQQRLDRTVRRMNGDWNGATESHRCPGDCDAEDSSDDDMPYIHFPGEDGDLPLSALGQRAWSDGEISASVDKCSYDMKVAASFIEIWMLGELRLEGLATTVVQFLIGRPARFLKKANRVWRIEADRFPPTRDPLSEMMDTAIPQCSSQSDDYNHVGEIIFDMIDDWREIEQLVATNVDQRQQSMTNASAAFMAEIDATLAVGFRVEQVAAFDELMAAEFPANGGPINIEMVD